MLMWNNLSLGIILPMRIDYLIPQSPMTSFLLGGKFTKKTTHRRTKCVFYSDFSSFLLKYQNVRKDLYDNIALSYQKKALLIVISDLATKVHISWKSSIAVSRYPPTGNPCWASITPFTWMALDNHPLSFAL